MKTFRDKFGNLLPNSWDTQSENPTVFNVVYFFSKSLNKKFSYSCQLETRELTAAKYLTNHNTWRTMEHDDNPDFSVDEKVSTLAFFNYDKNEWWIDKIPVFPSFNNSSWLSWYRPDVMAYTLIIKYPWMKKLLRWIIGLKTYRSIVEFDKNPQGESSGVQLAFIMFMGLREFDLVDEGTKVWKRAMDIYYPEEDHPTRLLWEKESAR